MSPHRVKQHPWILLTGVVIGIVIMLSFGAVALLLGSRAEALNEHIYEQCIRDETQDTIMVAQLRAARRRAMASLPPASAERIYQLNVLDDGIAALEPPDEQPCEPPEGVSP